MSNHRTKQRLSHPYMRPDFWRDPANHFWNQGNYTERSRTMLALEASLWVEKHSKLNTLNGYKSAWVA